MSASEPDPSGIPEVVGDARLLLITAPNESVALGLAREMVAACLAACVNVLPGLTSVYRWQGEVHEDSEALLIAKTWAGAREALERLVREKHPYDVPELVMLLPSEVEGRYLEWWYGQVRTCGGQSEGPAKAGETA